MEKYNPEIEKYKNPEQPGADLLSLKKQDNGNEEKNNSDSDIEINNSEIIEYFNSEYEKTMETYKKVGYKETIQSLERIAQQQGFDGILISKEFKDGIAIPSYMPYEKSFTDKNNITQKKIGICKLNANKIIFGEDLLHNARKLFRTDEKFAEEGISILFRHEKQHLENPAAVILDKWEKGMEEAARDKNIKDFKSLEKRSKEVYDKFYPKAEMQTEIQRINEEYLNYENLDDFIESEAKAIAARMILVKGLENLKLIKSMLNRFLNPTSKQVKELQKYPGTYFIKPEAYDRNKKKKVKIFQEVAKRSRQMLYDMGVKYDTLYPPPKKGQPDLRNIF